MTHPDPETADGTIDGDAGVPGPGVSAPLFTAQLDPGLDEALHRFVAHPRIVVGLDFDGVLAPLVLDPTTSRVLPASAEAVVRLAGLPDVEVAVVSGRDAEDLVALADLPDKTRVIGSHGAQWGRSAVGPDGAARLAADPVDLTEDQAVLRAELLRETEALAAPVDGAWVQAKPTAIVVHTRPAGQEQAETLTRQVLDGPGAREGVRVILGKEVIELAVVAVTKGDALLELRSAVGADAALYAGDDTTDEDAFTVLDAATGDVPLKVGDGATRAAYRVADPDELSAVLLRLAELRERVRPAISQETDTFP
ncbi:trehalose-phosphatase [Georgenia alba]|uniref:Trehalose 6-phosphate phosphatase n=1 Tax=Georgenia alba TaxID=2233858 RepID=A0ABW2Q4Q9_9MICO